MTEESLATPKSVESSAPASRSRLWLRRAVVVIAWASALGLWFGYRQRTGLSTTGAAQRLVDQARGNWWAVVAYFVVSIARPLVLFPAVLVTIAAGMLFGPIGGTAVAVGAANASAMVAYWIGRSIGPRRGDGGPKTTLAGWAERLRENSFEAVLMMRLLFLPYDLVNYGCGLAKVRPWPFITATAIGSFPGTLAFVLVGASITNIDEGLRGVDARTLAASVGIVVISLAGSRYLKRRSSVEGNSGR